MAVSVSLKILAEILGLAPSTVSRALKGHPDISRATRGKVEALARELHYKPNALALSLRSKKSNLIAIIVPLLGNYFYACAVSSVIRYAYLSGYKVIVLENNEQVEQEMGICRFLQNSGIDGLIVVPAKTTDNVSHFVKLQNEGVSMVSFDRIVAGLDTDRVLGDDYNGAFQAVGHMISGGCRKIAHIAMSQKYVWAQKRKMGYEQALRKGYSTHSESLVVEYDDLSEVCGICRNLVQNNRVDGIFAADDACAVEVVNALRQMKCRIPEAVAVCGYGNDPVSAAVYPSLTTVNRNGYRMGELAAELLIRRIDSEGGMQTSTRLLKNELVVRDSTLPFG